MFFFQITVENSPAAVPNGHIVADAVRQTDVESSMLLMTTNRTSSPSVSPKKTENSDVTNDHRVIPVIITDTAGAYSVQQNGEVIMKNASPVVSQNQSENVDVNWHRKVVPVVVEDVADAGAFQQSVEVTMATSSRSIYRKKGEKTALNRHQEVSKDVAKADGGDVTMETSSHLIYKKKSERSNANRHQEVVPVVINDVAKTDAVRQNGKIVAETMKQGPLTKKREQETQVKSLHIEEDGDDDDIIEEEQSPTAENASDANISGAEMFASSRPHAWHHELTKKCHEPVHEVPLDRQV